MGEVGKRQRRERVMAFLGERSGLLLVGAGLFTTSAVGLFIPGSISAYPHSIAAGEPMNVLYAFPGGWLLLTGTLVLLCGLFSLALRLAARTAGAAGLATAIAAALVILFVGIYPSSSQDLFHNIASARTLWVYGENPMVTPPAAHPDDPLVRQVRAWRDESSFYGPLFYVLSVAPSRLAGDDVLLNLLAFKALHGLALLALALLAGAAADLLAPGRRTQAIVMVGWNPLLLYESVANAHNDILMSVAAVGGLLVAARGRGLAGVLVAALSAALKYPAGALVPVVWLWSLKRSGPRERIALVAFAVGAALCLASLLVLFAGQIEIGRETAIGRPPVRSAVALLDHPLQSLLGSGALSIARIACWGVFVAVLLFIARRLDGSARSLFHAAFWVMAAITLVTVRQIYPSYLIWFICLGAILVGSVAWEMSVLASISGLLSNVVLTDWSTWSAADDLVFMAVFVGVPAAILAASRLGFGLRRPAPQPPPLLE
jgi:hypothetical protein